MLTNIYDDSICLDDKSQEDLREPLLVCDFLSLKSWGLPLQPERDWGPQTEGVSEEGRPCTDLSSDPSKGPVETLSSVRNLESEESGRLQ